MSSLYVLGNNLLLEKLKFLYENEKKFGYMFENINNVAIYGCSKNREIIFWNKSCEKLYGFKKQEVIGKKVEDFLIPKILKSKAVSNIDSWLQNDTKLKSCKMQFRCKDGNKIRVYSNHIIVNNPKGEKEIFCFSLDLTELTDTNRMFKRELSLRKSILYMADLMIVILDKDANIVEFNEYAQKLSGYTKEDVLYKNWFDVFIDTEQKEKIKDVFDDVIKGKNLHWGYENEIVCKNGSKKTLSWHNSIIEEKKNERFVLSMGMDITDKINTQKSLEKLANYDQLTGLPNRNLFEERLKHAIANAQREKKQLMLLLLDIDNFKAINDTLGHRVGDLLLKKVGDKLNNSLRKSDTIARFGGDFFVLLFENIKDDKNIVAIINNIFRLFQEPLDVECHEIYVTISGGISLYPNDCDDLDCLLKSADIALHNIKKDGKNDFCFYSPQMNDEITKRVKLESYLRKALDKNELFLNYQPQIDIKSGKIIGVEALLRWRHPKLNIIPPLDFIPIAEDTKMILQIGKFALKKAISQLKEWQKSGIRDIKMVVNISAVQLAQGNLFETVKEILEQYEVDPKYFEIELTESVLMKNTQQAKKTLALFQKEGIEIAIDDFGTGYSSLAYLKKFPINRLKIDKTFIDDLPADTDDIAITKAIISMGKSLGMRVVAEGVEEKEQLDFLMEQGCDEVQGYCFSKPLLADEFVTFYKYHDFGKLLGGNKSHIEEKRKVTI